MYKSHNIACHILLPPPPSTKDCQGWSCLLVPDDPTELFLSPNPLCHANDDIENQKNI